MDVESLLNQIQELAEADLYVLAEAVELELQGREGIAGEFADSARRRAVEREQSYRRRAGAGAPPIRVVGIGKPGKRRAA
jgi:hypothetical protein